MSQEDPRASQRTGASQDPLEPDDDEFVPEDDTVIATAFKWSLLAMLFIGAGIAVVIALRSREPEPESEEVRPVIPAREQVRTTAVPAVTFRDITRQAGIDFRHTSGATGGKYLPETMGGGCAFFDGREVCRRRTNRFRQGRIGFSWHNVKFHVKDLTVTGQLHEEWARAAVAKAPRPRRAHDAGTPGENPKTQNPKTQNPKTQATLAGPSAFPSSAGPAGRRHYSRNPRFLNNAG